MRKHRELADDIPRAHVDEDTAPIAGALASTALGRNGSRAKRRRRLCSGGSYRWRLPVFWSEYEIPGPNRLDQSSASDSSAFTSSWRTRL